MHFLQVDLTGLKTLAFSPFFSFSRKQARKAQVSESKSKKESIGRDCSSHCIQLEMLKTPKSGEKSNLNRTVEMQKRGKDGNRTLDSPKMEPHHYPLLHGPLDITDVQMTYSSAYEGTSSPPRLRSTRVLEYFLLVRFNDLAKRKQMFIPIRRRLYDSLSPFRYASDTHGKQ